MASIFEQYEQHTARASSSIPQVAREPGIGVPPVSISKAIPGKWFK